MEISLRRLPRTGERGGSGDGAAQANTRRCPEAGQRDQEIGRLPGCCAERKMVEAHERAWTGSQRSEDKGCTSGVWMRIPARMTQRAGAGLAGERNTAGVHDGPRTDERWARAWVRKPGIALAGTYWSRRGYQPSLAPSSMCTGVGFSSDELRPTLGCEGARSCGVAGRRHRAGLPVDAGTRAVYGSSAMRQQCYEGAVL